MASKKRRAASEDGGGGTSGAGTVTQDPPKKSARRAPQPRVMVELREMGSNAESNLPDVAVCGEHYTVVGVASGVVDFGDETARIDDLRMIQPSLLTKYRDTLAYLRSLHESIVQSPKPRLGFQLDAFDFPKGNHGQA